MSWNSYDLNNAGTPGGGWGWGGGSGFAGTALAAGAGALVGGLLFGNNNLLGGRNDGLEVAKDVAVETSKGVSDLQGTMFAASLAAADRGYQQTIAFNQQSNAIDRDVLTTSYDTSRQMCDGFNTSNVVSLQNKYDNSMQLASLGYQQEKCCCDTNLNLVKMGYETQLRDQSQFGIIMKELAEVKCTIKETEAAEIMRDQAARICALEGSLNKAEIIAAMKPVAPVPAYIQGNPYENFRPVVRVEHERHDCDRDCRWSY